MAEPILTPEQHNVMSDLFVLGDRRRRLRVQQADLAARLNPTILRALRLGCGPTEIAKAAGMSRTAVYKLVDASK